MNALESVLQLTRRSAYAMNMVVKELGFGNQGMHFDGENQSAWAIVNEYEVRSIQGTRHIADIHWTAGQVTIVIPDYHNLIRSEHMADFDYRMYDLDPLPPPDWKGERDPALVINWSMPPDVAILQGPRQYIPESTFRRKPKVTGSLNYRKKSIH